MWTYHFSAVRTIEWKLAALKFGQNVIRQITGHHTNILLIHIGLPFHLFIGQLQEPANILRVVSTSVCGEKVSKEPLHESADALVVAMEVRSEHGGGEDFDGYVGDITEPWTV